MILLNQIFSNMNKKELSYRDALIYNPYDNNRRPKSLDYLNFSDIRIIPQTYLDEKRNLTNIISPASNFSRQFYIISGYSGNGKTTFLYWFQEQIIKEGFWFEITNLIEQAHGIEDDFKLVQKSIIHKFKVTILKKVTLNFIFEHKIIFRAFFSKELIARIADLKNDINYDIYRSLDLIEILEFNQLLLLYVLDKVLDFINNPEFKNTKSFTFCFDNLDELRFEYITPKMWESILDLSSNLRYIIQNTKISFDEKKITFILVFREANIACGIAALNDRLSPAIRGKRFIYTSIAKEIIERRMQLVDKDLDEDDLRFKFLIESIINDRILDFFILPLFNYDYRKLSEAIADCVQPEVIGNKKYRIFDTDKDDYLSIPAQYNYLKRGILINMFIRYFAKENYLEKLAPIRNGWSKETPYCNKTRLLLTVFSNLSFPNGYPQSLKELAEIKPITFTLYSAYCECKMFVENPIEYFKILKTLIDLDKSSWAHLITVYGKQPIREFNSYNFDFSLESVLFEKKNRNESLTETEEKYLNEFVITLNASAYAYLRHILTHFEYISGYKTKNSSSSYYSLKPLILSTKSTVINKEIAWEFQSQIINVYEIVELYVYNNSEFFKIKNSGKDDKKSKIEYCTSKYVFRGDFNNHLELIDEFKFEKLCSFYSSRLIATHIEYLDNFRQYITNEGFNKIEMELSRTDKASPSLNTRGKIHEFVLLYIEKYIGLLEFFGDPSMINIKDKLKNALTEAKNNNKLLVRVKQPSTQQPVKPMQC